MRHTEILKAIMAKKKLRQYDLAMALGFSNISTISLRINRKKGCIMKTVELLEAMDYEMVIRKAKKGPLAENEYVLHFRDYEED